MLPNCSRLRLFSGSDVGAKLQGIWERTAGDDWEPEDTKPPPDQPQQYPLTGGEKYKRPDGIEPPKKDAETASYAGRNRLLRLAEV